MENYYAKLTDDQLALIISLVRHRKSYEDIVNLYPSIPLSKCVYHALIYDEDNDIAPRKKETFKRNIQGFTIKKGMQQGVQNVAAKLTEDQVKQIKQYFKEDKSYAEIFTLMPEIIVTLQTLEHIKHGKNWTHIE